MSIYVACQCGQAFSAPPELAGQTLPCPACQRPLTVGAGSATYQQPAPTAFGQSPFAASGGANPTYAPAVQAAGGDEDSPLLVWLSIGGGGLALVVVIGLMVYNATRKSSIPATASATPAATSIPTTTPPASTSPTTAPATFPAPSATSSAAPIATPSPVVPTGASTIAPAPSSAAPPPVAADFVKPAHGEMFEFSGSEFEVWFPGKPLFQTPTAASGIGRTQLAMFAVQSDHTAFVFMEVEFPQAMTIEHFEKHMRESGGGHMPMGGNLQQTRTKLAGYDAIEYNYDAPSPQRAIKGRSIFVVAGTKGYSLTVVGPSTDASAGDARAFFASFRKKK